MRALVGILIVLVLALVSGVLTCHLAGALAPDVPPGLRRARRRVGGGPP